MKKSLPASIAILAIAASVFAGSKSDVVTTINANNMHTLAALITKSGLVPSLQAKVPFTVFGPTDAAFDDAMKSMPGASDYLNHHPEVLKKIVLYHVVNGSIMSKSFHNSQKVKTLEGEFIIVTMKKNQIILNGNSVMANTNMRCTNGVVHSISAVLIPPTVRKMIGQSMIHPRTAVIKNKH